MEPKATVKPFADRNPGVTSEQKSIGVDRPDKPIFLVKGATMLKPGPATTIYRGGKEEKDVLVDASNPASRKPKQLKLGDQEYQLKVLAQNVRPAKLQLALVSGAQTQILYTPKTVAGTAVPKLRSTPCLLNSSAAASMIRSLVSAHFADFGFLYILYILYPLIPYIVLISTALA